MTENESSEVEVRAAVKEDIAAIHGLISELADFESLQHQFVATVGDLEQGLTGENRAAEALVAVVGNVIVGYAIFFSILLYLHRQAGFVAGGFVCAARFKRAGYRQGAYSGGQCFG
jgi:hypothetical protein